MKYTSNIKSCKVFNIIFILSTTFCVLFTICYFFNEFLNNSFLTFIIFCFYIYTYYCHTDLNETFIKQNYIEREKYDILLKELLEKQKNKEAN